MVSSVRIFEFLSDFLGGEKQNMTRCRVVCRKCRFASAVIEWFFYKKNLGGGGVCVCLQ